MKPFVNCFTKGGERWLRGVCREHAKRKEVSSELSNNNWAKDEPMSSARRSKSAERANNKLVLKVLSRCSRSKYRLAQGRR